MHLGECTSFAPNWMHITHKNHLPQFGYPTTDIRCHSLWGLSTPEVINILTFCFVRYVQSNHGGYIILNNDFLVKMLINAVVTNEQILFFGAENEQRL